MPPHCAVRWSVSDPLSLAAALMPTRCQRYARYDEAFKTLFSSSLRRARSAVEDSGTFGVGRKIQAQAARNLTRTQLELGGKNALIVMADAGLDASLDAAVTAGFSNAGQWCTSTSRILLQRSIAGEFIMRRLRRRFASRLFARRSRELMRTGSWEPMNRSLSSDSASESR